MLVLHFKEFALAAVYRYLFLDFVLELNQISNVIDQITSSISCSSCFKNHFFISLRPVPYVVQYVLRVKQKEDNERHHTMVSSLLGVVVLLLSTSVVVVVVDSFTCSSTSLSSAPSHHHPSSCQRYSGNCCNAIIGYHYPLLQS